MSYELIYTHAAHTLRAKRAGHGTVAMTRGLPDAVAELLESLSFPAPGEDRPTTWSHIRLVVEEHPVQAVSRITPIESASGDPAILAHHVVVPVAERPAGGPAWLMQQPGFLRGTWPKHAAAEWLPAGPPVPQGGQRASVCHQWAKLTGDAGWAGVLVEAFLREPEKAAYVLVPPGVDPLPLLAEALALLPEPKRWEVTFSTHHTRLPDEATCVWRCVPRGSAAARAAQRADVLVIDLAGMGPAATGGPFVELARTGRDVDTIPMPTAWPRDLLADEPAYVEPADDATEKRRQRAARLAAQAKAGGSPDIDSDEPPRRSTGLGWLMFLGLFFNVGIILLVASLWWLLDRPQPQPLAGGPDVPPAGVAPEPNKPPAAPEEEPEQKKPAPVRPGDLQGVAAAADGVEDPPEKPGPPKKNAEPGEGDVAPPPIIGAAPGGEAPPAPAIGKNPKPPGNPVAPAGPNAPDAKPMPGDHEFHGGLRGLQTPPVIPIGPAPPKPEGGGGGGLIGLPAAPIGEQGKAPQPGKGPPARGPGGGLMGVVPGGMAPAQGLPPQGPAIPPQPRAPEPPPPADADRADPRATEYVTLPPMKDLEPQELTLSAPIPDGTALSLWGLVGDDGQKLQTRKDGPSKLDVVQPAKSDLLDDVPVARFTLEKNVLVFQWFDHAKTAPSAPDRILQRCVLELKHGDQVRYVALGGPVLQIDLPHKAELALNRGQQIRQVPLPDLPANKWRGLHIRNVTVQFDFEPPLTLRPRRPGAEMEVSHRVDPMQVTVGYENGRLVLKAMPERGRGPAAGHNRMLLRQCTLAARVGSIRVDVARYSFADTAP